MLERITRREEFELFIAWIALSFAFGIYFIRVSGISDFSMIIKILGISLVTAGVGFVAHEMAHKFSAIKFGFWAEFKKNDVMLLISVVIAALGVGVFAAPGATVIYSNSSSGQGLTKRENGIISASGPFVNLLLCIPFAILILLTTGGNQSFNQNFALIGILGFQVNAMFALFNMLPISILDGKKVWNWNKLIFIVLIGAAIGALLLSYYPRYL
jgi:Zn-dependent protease